jgi:hypothetical protein
MWSIVKSIIAAIVGSLANSFLAAKRRKRQDDELKKAAKDEVLLDAERVKNEALKKWQKHKRNSVGSVINSLRNGKF